LIVRRGGGARLERSRFARGVAFRDSVLVRLGRFGNGCRTSR